MTWREFGKYWLPVVLWMALIFAISTDLGSTGRTSRLIGPVLKFFWPDVSEKTIYDVQVAVRKFGHLSGYAILAVLVLRARNRGFLTTPWRRESALFAEGVSLVYAISDEVHQSFVPTRYASVWDVLIDCVGAAFGLAAVWAIGRTRGKW